MEGINLIGYGICDLDEYFTDLNESLKKLGHVKVVELQPEKDIWDFKNAKQYLDNYLFKSFHMPTQGVDITSLNADYRKMSIEKVHKSMDKAEIVKCDLYVIHPLHCEWFISPNERRQRKNLFIEAFEKEIIPYHDKKSHSYGFGIENIEYSKYPATLEELLEIKTLCDKTCKTSMVVDIPHIWNTRRILRENSYLNGNILGFPDETNLVNYLKSFIDKNYQDISLYHVANFGENPIRTHDSIIPGRVNEELISILPFLEGKPIILEVYHHDIPSVIISRKTAWRIKNGKY